MYAKNRNTGGRPVKSIGEKLKYKVTVKLATADFYTLKAKTKMAGINQSEYIRACIRNSDVKPRLTTEQTAFLRQLCGMANNLNQIARKANSTGFSAAKTDCNRLAEYIDRLITQIRYDGKNQ
jgi:hypothetical protein